MAATTGLNVTPPSTPAPAAGPHIYSAGELEALWINAGGAPTLAIPMAAIALAESGGNPSAHNPSGATGLWQILGNPFPGNAYDPATNAKMAVAKYKSQGAAAWTTYTSGAYKQFMQQATTAFKNTFHGVESPSQAAINAALQGIPGAGGVVAGGQLAGTLGIPNPLSPIEQVAAVLARFADLLTSSAFWIRLGEGIAAVFLLYLGLHALTGQSSTPGQQVKHVTRIIPI